MRILWLINNCYLIIILIEVLIKVINMSIIERSRIAEKKRENFFTKWSIPKEVFRSYILAY